MASITSLTSSSSTSSIYGNRNVISGLASGMDTEAMIENSISGYKAKINKLQQRMTKIQWKQDAYRNIIAQMNNVLSKYTSYTSSTNLFSSSFFTKAVTTTANGANAAKVAASGKSTSDVQLDRVLQMAQAASYNTSSDALAAQGASIGKLDLSGTVETSGVEGSITLKYGGGTTGSGTSITLRFEEGEVYDNAEDLAKAINDQLKEKNIRSSGGSSTADNFIKAEATADGRIVLNDIKGNYFAVTGVSGGMESVFSKSEADGRVIASKAPVDEKMLKKETSTLEYLKDKSLTFNLDGKSKSIKLDFVDKDTTAEDFQKKLQKKVNEAFGDGKIEVSLSDDGALKFGAPGGKDFAEGTTLTVSGTAKVNEALGMKEAGYSNTLQTSWKLSDVLSEEQVKSMFNQKQLDAEGKPIDDSEAKYANLTINGKTIQVTKDDTIKNVMDKINSSDAGVSIKYSNLTGRFAITANETGADTKIDIEGELGKALFGDVSAVQKANETLKSDDATDDEKAAANELLAKSGYTAGQDAKFTVTVNGQQMELTRASNTVDLDGLSVTLKGTFGYQTDEETGEVKLGADGKPLVDKAAEPVTFTTTSDSDKIVDAIKEFIDDYNTLATAIHDAYITEPLKDSSKNYYEPLTSDQEDGMSESAIKNYEEKAKTGLLFGDSDLSNLYSRLTNAVQGNGEVGSMLRSIGITTNYSNRLTTLELDEDALRNALENNPDRVKDAFTQTTANGASQNGLMANLKSTLEMYGSTSIASPGILVSKAGSTLSSYSLSNNELNDQLESLQEQVESWQDKMSDRIDYYTNQFTQLEMLIQQMNSQSSMLAGLSGGY